MVFRKSPFSRRRINGSKQFEIVYNINQKTGFLQLMFLIVRDLKYISKTERIKKKTEMRKG